MTLRELREVGVAQAAIMMPTVAFKSYTMSVYTLLVLASQHFIKNRSIIDSYNLFTERFNSAISIKYGEYLQE